MENYCRHEFVCYEEQFNLIFMRDSLKFNYYALLVTVGYVMLLCFVKLLLCL